MKEIIQEIFHKELSVEILSIEEIKGLGSVNQVFEVKGNKEAYIIRLNEAYKRLEYQKEYWCMNKLAELGIPTPKVLGMGMMHDLLYMIQAKVPGINGSTCKPSESPEIWQQLGSYAATYQQIKRIEEDEVEAAEFHKDWKARLQYNLDELNEDDSLLQQEIFSRAAQQQAKEVLSDLALKDFDTGLVHGDLSPRNVILNEGTGYLLDWGTAEINVVPHMEIGILLMSGEASDEEFQLFLAGFGISALDYKEIEGEINLLNLLHHLDKYRWAEGQQGLDLEEFAVRVRETFDRIKPNY